MDSLDLAGTNLTSPAVLAFGLGAASVFMRTDLKLPEAIHSALTVYLLLAIGLKGGAELSISSPGDVWLPALAAVALGLAIPFWSYGIARRLGRMGVPDAAALAAHYGSVSIVTFTATLAFLDQLSVPVEGYMTALVALMEVPAIVVALLIARRAIGGDGGLGAAVREVFGGRGVVLLLGGLTIGLLSGKDGLDRVGGFFVEPFAGVLVLFLLEMGVTAAGRLKDLRKGGLFLVAFGTALPLFHGFLGAVVGAAVGLSVGGTTVLAALAASASYIAAPAAVRLALPQANPGYYLTAALAITFPFNLAIGIPLYYRFASLLA